jgi:hypothetical protein
MKIISANITGSLILNNVDVSSITGSQSSINSLNNKTGSYAVTGSNVFIGNQTITGSLTITETITGSISNAISSSYAFNSDLLDGRDSLTFAGTGSNVFIGNQNINGSVAITGSLTTTGTITAQTINVQQVTSSIIYSSGSNVFGNSLSNTQSMTGSVGITGSLAVTGATTFSGDLTANVGTITFTNAANVYMPSIIRNGATGKAFFQYDGTDTRLLKLSTGLWSVRNDANNANLLTITDAGAVTISSNLTLGGYLTGQGTNPGGLGASRYVVDFNAGNTRIFSYGANTSTAGGYLFYIQSSDGSVGSIPLSIASTGEATFSAGITGTSARFNNSSGAGNFILLNDGNVAFGAALGLGSSGDFVISSIASSVVTERFRIARTGGVATFTSSAAGLAGMNITNSSATSYGLDLIGGGATNFALRLRNYDASTTALTVTGAGVATFASSITLSGTITNFGTGTGIYTRSVWYNDTSNQILFENARATDAADGTGRTVYFTWRGGPSVGGGVQLQHGTNAWAAYTSDARLKTKVADVENGLSAIMQLEPIKFKWSRELENSRTVTGFTAQNVEQAIPDAVFNSWKDEELGDVKSYYQDYLIPYLVKAIQELSAKITQLENNIT